MTYEKPYDITYTQMCIYIDTHVYTDDYDVSLVFQYLYLLVRMLSMKERYFTQGKEYDDFSIYSATRLYNRLTNKKQFEYTSEGEPLLKPVKSILNYIKRVLYNLCIDFIHSDYYDNSCTTKTVDTPNISFNNLLIRNTDSIEMSEFRMTLSDISNCCRNFLSQIPYSRNSSTWMNIYISVLLTFLDSVTVNKYDKDILLHLKETGSYTDKKLENMYDKERKNAPTLFHLSENYSNYIIVLSRRLRHYIANILSSILQTRCDSDFLLNRCIENALEVSNDNQQST